MADIRPKLKDEPVLAFARPDGDRFSRPDAALVREARADAPKPEIKPAPEPAPAAPSLTTPDPAKPDPATLAPTPPDKTSETAAPPAPKKGQLRKVLLALGPVVAVVVGIVVYLDGGRYVETDNAYVRADKLNLATDVPGIVAAIAVGESQAVTKGQILFRLDDEPYRIALAGTEAQLGAIRNEIATLQATYRQNLAQIAQARTDIGFYQTAFERQQNLISRGVSTQASFDQAKRDLDLAHERVTVAERQSETTLAQLGGNVDGAVAENPRFLQVKSQVDKARRDLAHTAMLAPMAGIVTNVKALQIGQYLAAAQAGFSLVGSDEVWIEANPKETDLTYLKVGEPAEITIDAYPGVKWAARVASISPASGAEFSVLPAQNASGNWVKVVQRLPIRLSIERPADGPALRSGMSADVSIDTGRVRTLDGLWAEFRHSVGL